MPANGAVVQMVADFLETANSLIWLDAFCDPPRLRLTRTGCESNVRRRLPKIGRVSTAIRQG